MSPFVKLATFGLQFLIGVRFAAENDNIGGSCGSGWSRLLSDNAHVGGRTAYDESLTTMLGPPFSNTDGAKPVAAPGDLGEGRTDLTRRDTGKDGEKLQ